jgi:DNA-binding response OmpR family regulator
VTETVILVDDDPDFAEELTLFLEGHGVRCAAVIDPALLMPLLDEMNPDLLLLDQRLGTTTGMEVLRQVRAVSMVPCVFLTGMQDPIDRILGLELGADDYIHKTAMPREILARIRAVLRRTRTMQTAPPTAPRDWDFRPGARELYRPDGSRCHLTSSEFTLLHALIGARGEPMSREALTERVFDRPYRPGDRAIDGLIVRLRRKLEPNPEEPTVIKSARQQGYLFSGFAVGRTASEP